MQRGRAENSPVFRNTGTGLRRQHPAALFSYAGGFFFTAAAPLAALIPLMLMGQLPTLVLLTPLVPLGMYCAVCVLHWRSRVWACTRVLTDCGGLLTKHADVVGRGSLSRIELVRTPVLGLTGAVRLTVEDRCVQSGRARTLVLPAREGVLAVRRVSGCTMSGRQGLYAASLSSSALLALSGSNFASGLLLVIPFAVRMGKLAGQAFDRRLYDELGRTTAELLPKLPPIYALAAGLLAVGYGVHFLSNFFAGANHRSYISDGCTVIAGGAVTRRVSVILPGCVSVLETRQTLLMSMLRRRSCYVHTVGAGRSLCLIPPQKSRSFTRIRAALFPRPDHTGAVVRPDRAHLRLYSQSSYLFSFAFAALGAALGERGGILSAAAFALAAVLMWRALVGRIASRSAKIRMCAEYVELSGVGGLCARTWRIPREKVARITVRTTPFDLLRGTCTVAVRAAGMRGEAKCSYLPCDRVRALCERLAQ